MPNPERDIELMQRVKQGDHAAFQELYEAYKRPLAGFFYKLTYDPSVTEDCIQEVFLRAWRAAGNWEPTGKVSTYLFTIAHNYWINEGKRGKKRPAPFSQIAGANDEEGGRGAEFEGPAVEPVESMEKRELRDAVRKAIEELPEHERVVLVLSEYEGLKYQEIGEICGIPEGTVKSRIWKACTRLKKILAKYVKS